MAQSYECVVCYEQKSSSEFPNEPITSLCSHEHQSICRLCVQQSITAQSESKVYNQIDCPHERCQCRLSYTEVEKWASHETFARYEALTLREGLEGLPEFRWCHGAGCSYGECHANGEAMPRVRCAACKVLNCFKHRTLWHRGSTCEDIDNNAAAGAEAAEAATLEVIQANCKACPGKIQATGTVCGTMIMKNGGCIHMTCVICGSEWCWGCLRDWALIETQGDRGHMRDCIMFKDRGLLPSGRPSYFPDYVMEPLSSAPPRVAPPSNETTTTRARNARTGEERLGQPIVPHDVIDLTNDSSDDNDS